MAPHDAAVARILSASTHYDVLELPCGDAGGALVPTAAVRRKYKELAVRVHPDKNRAEGAADAFKRLSEAYECLADEQLQRVYYQAMHQRKRKPPPPPRPPPPGPAAPDFPRKQRGKQKRRPPPPSTPPPPSSSQPPLPRPWRTPEEVWTQFQREEEEQAMREFRERGFERDYDNREPNDRKKRRPNGPESPPSHPHREDKEVEAEGIGVHHSQGVEERAQDWIKWKRSNAHADEPTAASASRKATPSAPCCLLCRRKFPTAEALARHDKLSALHKENLVRQLEAFTTRSPC